MPEEACEALVKVFLESQDYLVTTNKKVRIRHKVKAKIKQGFQIHNSPNEIDIIAYCPKTKRNIIGEVKGWQSGLHKYHFRKLHKPTNNLQKAGQKALRIINDTRHRNRVIDSIKKIYKISNFDLILFVDHINLKDEKLLERFAKREHFSIITFSQILNKLNENVDKFSYSNDPLLQMLRIQKRLNKTNQKK